LKGKINELVTNITRDIEQNFKYAWMNLKRVTDLEIIFKKD